MSVKNLNSQQTGVLLREETVAGASTVSQNSKPTDPPCQTETNKWKCWIDRAVDLIDFFNFDEKTLTFTIIQGHDVAFYQRVQYIIDNFKSVINAENVNKYEEYDASYKADKYGLWRKGESFTPVLYLAKASPVCAKAMLLILLEKTADLTLLAKTKGCFISRKCTSVGKLARKFYFYIYNNGKSKSLVPKTIEMYKSLKELSMGKFKGLNGTSTFRNYQNKVLGTSAFNERLTGVSAIMKPWTANAILGGGALAGTVISLVLFPPVTATAYVIARTAATFSISVAFAIGVITSFNMSNKLSLRDKGLLLIKEVNDKISEKQEEALATGAIEQMNLAVPQEKQAEEEEKHAHLVQEAQEAQEAQESQGETAATATEFKAAVQPLRNRPVNQGLQRQHNIQINQSVTGQFVPVLEDVLTNTEQVTLGATQALKGKGIDAEVEDFEEDVKRKIAETRARLNQVKNVPGTAPGQGAPPGPGQGAPPANSNQMLPNIIRARNQVPSSATTTVPLGYSSSDNLNLLRILNESLINTIKQVIEQMGTANTDFIRRALGYIQILLIQLQNLTIVFNRLDKRMGNIEKRLKMGRNTSMNTSQPDLAALRTQLEEVMRLAPSPPVPVVAPAPKGWFRNPFARTKGGYSRKLSKTKRKTPAKTRKRPGHKKASRKK